MDKTFASTERLIFFSKIQGRLDERRRVAVKFAEVTSHATGEMVRHCRVILEDQEGNAAADEAADVGVERRVQNA